MSDLGGGCPEPPARAGAEDYDQGLGFLATLEREVGRQARDAARDHARLSRTWRGPGRRSAPMRVARRSLTLVALLCLIGATAYGAHRVFSSGSGGSSSPELNGHGAFVLAAQGDSGERWMLRLYRRGPDLCRVLVVTESESSRCAPAPAPRTLGVTDAVGPLRRYVFGVTGSAVAKVAVHAEGETQTVATRAPDPLSARAAGLPPGARWFVAILTRPIGRPDPPTFVHGLDAAGHPVGPVRVDCVQTPDPVPCP